MKNKVLTKLLGVLCIAVLAFAAPAMAQSSVQGGYDEAAPLSQLGDADGDGPANDTAANDPQELSSGSLPFTGFDLGIALLLGMALVGTGLAVRRVTRTG